MKSEDFKNFADALVGLKYDLILINLLVLCIAIVAVYFLARIKKSAELKEINNNFATVLEQQAELAEETGKIKQSLDKDSINYQIRLNAYHDKSIEAINDIYVAIIKLREAAKDLGFTRTEEENKKFFTVISEFRYVFDTKKIWIPKLLSDHIEGVAIELDNRSHKFIISTTREKHIERLSEQQVNKIFDDQEAFYNYIHQEVGVVFDELVKKISETVGT